MFGEIEYVVDASGLDVAIVVVAATVVRGLPVALALSIDLRLGGPCCICISSCFLFRVSSDGVTKSLSSGSSM